jgi:hypothetical protein
MKRHWLMLFIALTLVRCGQPDMPSAPAISETPLNVVALEYRLIDFLTDGRGFSAVDHCDYEYDPVFQAEGFEERGRLRIAEFARDNSEGLALIQKTVGLLSDPATLNTTDTLALYHEIRTLGESVYLHDYANARHHFMTRIKNATGSPIRVEGTISDYGAIEVLSQEPEYFTCPACLATGTRIDTPGGPVAVQDLRVGDVVWTRRSDGTRVAAPLLRVSRTAVPAEHLVVRVELDDGRSVTASLRHPTIDGRTFADLSASDSLDGGVISRLDLLPYSADYTYDLLPAGETGWYWADGVLIGSTLAP